MLTQILFLWNKCKSRAKSFNEMEYAVNWGHTYEQHERALKEDFRFNLKMKNYQWETWAFFGLLIIELDRLLDNHDGIEEINFNLEDNYNVYMRGKKKEINTFKEMVKFMRHGFCHPEEGATLRLDPYVLDRLKREANECDRSYHRVHFLKDRSNDRYYVQIGGGKLYFDEINRVLKHLKKVLKTPSHV